MELTSSPAAAMAKAINLDGNGARTNELGTSPKWHGTDNQVLHSGLVATATFASPGQEGDPTRTMQHAVDYQLHEDDDDNEFVEYCPVNDSIDQERYLVVNPVRYSNLSPKEVVESIIMVSLKLRFTHTIKANYVVILTGLLCAEEISVAIYPQRSIARQDITRIDFNQFCGDERNFLRMCDIIQFHSRDIYMDNLSLTMKPEWFEVDKAPITAPYFQFQPQSFMKLCEDFLSEIEWSDVVELAASIKSLCLSDKNRDSIVRNFQVLDTFEIVLRKMILCTSYEVVRYGVFILHLFLLSKQSGPYFRFDQNFLAAIDDMRTNDSIPRMRDIANHVASQFSKERHSIG